MPAAPSTSRRVRAPVYTTLILNKLKKTTQALIVEEDGSLVVLGCPSSVAVHSDGSWTEIPEPTGGCNLIKDGSSEWWITFYMVEKEAVSHACPAGKVELVRVRDGSTEVPPRKLWTGRVPSGPQLT